MYKRTARELWKKEKEIGDVVARELTPGLALVTHQTRPRANRGGARIAEARSRFGSGSEPPQLQQQQQQQQQQAQSSPTTPITTTNNGAARLDPDPAALTKLSEVCVPDSAVDDGRSPPPPPAASSSRSRSPATTRPPPQQQPSQPKEERLYALTLQTLASEMAEDAQNQRNLSKHLVECYREVRRFLGGVQRAA